MIDVVEVQPEGGIYMYTRTLFEYNARVGGYAKYV